MKKKNLILSVVVILLTTLTYAQEEKFFEMVDDTNEYTIVELAEMDSRFSTFLTFLKASGLDTSVEYVEGYTIFLPTNQAFEDMKLGELSQLTNPENKIKLVEFVKHYIIPQKVLKNQFNSSQVITVSEDKSIKINTELNGQHVAIGGANIIASDIESKNGIIHVIDQLVTPTDYFATSY